MSLSLSGGAACHLDSIRTHLALGVTAVGAIFRALVHRRKALQLSELPDHLLLDMGLRRDDVHAALRTSWRSDPTYLLAASARENRCKR